MNIASGATLALLTKTATTAASASFSLSQNTNINGNLVITNPLTLTFSANEPAITGAGAIQFQNMYIPPAPTHFTNATAQSLQLTGNYVTQTIGVNIELNSLNAAVLQDQHLAVR